MPFGYSDNGSRRLATRAQAGLRTYFQPQGKPYQFKLVQVPIPLEAYGATNPCEIWGTNTIEYRECMNPAAYVSGSNPDNYYDARAYDYAKGGAEYRKKVSSMGTPDTTAAVAAAPAATTTTTDTTKTSVDLAQYAPLAEAAGALLGTVASTLITKGYETKQTRIAAEAAAAAAPQTVVYQTYTKGTGEGLSGTTIALIAGAVVVVGGIVYFATQGGDEEEVEEEGAE